MGVRTMAVLAGLGLGGCFVEHRYELRCEEVARTPEVVQQGQAAAVTLTVSCDRELTLHDWMLASGGPAFMPASAPMVADRERGRDFTLQGTLPGTGGATPLVVSDLQLVATDEADLADVLVEIDWTVPP